MFVRLDRVWNRVSVCMCGESLGSCEYVYVWTEFGIVSVCVRVDRNWDHASVCTCGQTLESCEYVYMWI